MAMVSNETPRFIHQLAWTHISFIHQLALDTYFFAFACNYSNQQCLILYELNPGEGHKDFPRQADPFCFAGDFESNQLDKNGIYFPSQSASNT